MPVDIEIKFDGSSPLSPKVVLRNGEHIALLTHPRWVQLIALLAFKRISDCDSGRVSVDELKRSLAFRRLSHQNVSRFFYTSIHNQSPLVIDFIRTYLILPAAGPFRLKIGAHSILTDRKLLEAYIYLIFGKLNQSESQEDCLWQMAQNSIREFEFRSARSFISGCLCDESSPESSPSSKRIMALTSLASIEYLVRGNSPALDGLLAQAGALVSSLRDGAEKRLLQTIHLEKCIWTTPLENLSSRRTMRTNNFAIELASELPKKSSDRAALLIGRHYFSVYCALRYGTSTDVSREFSIITDYHRQLACSDFPKIVSYEPGSLKASKLQMALLRRANANEKAASEEISLYKDCLQDQSVSQINTISSAEWIADLELRAGSREHALEFLTEALLDHAPVHQTVMYARVKKMRDELKTQIVG